MAPQHNSLFDDEEEAAPAGRRGRRSRLSLLGSNDGLELSPCRRRGRGNSECQDLWQDELASCSSQQKHVMEEDPLLGLFSQQQQQEACEQDGALAALLAQEWKQQQRKPKQLLYRDHPATRREKVGGGILVGVLLVGLVALAGFAISHSSSSSMAGHYQCLGDLQEFLDLVTVVQTQNGTELCPEGPCFCQNPTLPASDLSPEALKEEANVLLASPEKDVVFLGQDCASFPATHLSSSALCVGGGTMAAMQARLSSPQYRDALLEMNPKLVWISLGHFEDFIHGMREDGCSLDAVLAGTVQLLRHLTTELHRPPDAVVLSVLDVLNRRQDDDSAWATELHQRLACLADSLRSTGFRVEVFPPLPVEIPEEDDDDFFLDVSSGGKSNAAVAPVETLTLEEQDRAILDKVTSMLETYEP